MEKSERPGSVEVGQRWQWMGTPPDTVEERLPNGLWRMSDGNKWDEKGILNNHRFVYLGGPSPAEPAEEPEEKLVAAKTPRSTPSVMVGQRRVWDDGDPLTVVSVDERGFECHFDDGKKGIYPQDILLQHTVILPGPPATEAKPASGCAPAPSNSGCSERHTGYGLPCTNHTPDYHEHTKSGARWPVVETVRLKAPTVYAGRPASALCSWDDPRANCCRNTVAHAGVWFCETHVATLMERVHNRPEPVLRAAGAPQLRGSSFSTPFGGIIDIGSSRRGGGR
jgi:hypothetical protein